MRMVLPLKCASALKDGNGVAVGGGGADVGVAVGAGAGAPGSGVAVGSLGMLGADVGVGCGAGASGTGVAVGRGVAVGSSEPPHAASTNTVSAAMAMNNRYERYAFFITVSLQRLNRSISSGI